MKKIAIFVTALLVACSFQSDTVVRSDILRVNSSEYDLFVDFAYEFCRSNRLSMMYYDWHSQVRPDEATDAHDFKLVLSEDLDSNDYIFLSTTATPNQVRVILFGGKHSDT